MYIFKNAWRNIIRNKGRNILIGVIILVIASACSITLAIRESANDIVESYQEKNKIEATIGMDRQSLMESLISEEKTQEEMINAFNDIAGITLDEINKYGDSEYVSNYYYTYDLSVDAKDLTEATDSLVKEKTEVTTETSKKTFKGASGGGPNFPPMGANLVQVTNLFSLNIIIYNTLKNSNKLQAISHKIYGFF